MKSDHPGIGNGRKIAGYARFSAHACYVPAEGRPISLQTFTITGAKIVAVDLIDDPGRIAEADLAILGR
jgi:hypothetical protein